MNIRFVSHPSNILEDWNTADFEDVEEALAELEELVHSDASALRLVFSLDFPSGLSLPHLWKHVVETLSSLNFAGDVHVWTPSQKVTSHFARYLPREQRPRSSFQCGSIEAVLTVGDLSQACADAIVNASNTRLELGGGVSHALRQRFGDALQVQMNALRDGLLEPGDGVCTTHPPETGVEAIYHVASDDGRPRLIRRCLESVVAMARDLSHSHIILPALGTGTGGLPISEFARLFCEFCLDAPSPLTLELWCWTLDDFECVREVFAQMQRTA